MTDLGGPRAAASVVTRRVPVVIVSRAKSLAVLTRANARTLVVERGAGHTVVHASGAQGAAGPRQFYVRPDFPVVSDDALLFRSGETADPDDLVPYVYDPA